MPASVGCYRVDDALRSRCSHAKQVLIPRRSKISSQLVNQWLATRVLGPFIALLFPCCFCRARDKTVAVSCCNNINKEFRENRLVRSRPEVKTILGSRKHQCLRRANGPSDGVESWARLPVSMPPRQLSLWTALTVSRLTVSLATPLWSSVVGITGWDSNPTAVWSPWDGTTRASQCRRLGPHSLDRRRFL